MFASPKERDDSDSDDDDDKPLLEKDIAAFSDSMLQYCKRPVQLREDEARMTFRWVAPFSMDRHLSFLCHFVPFDPLRFLKLPSFVDH